MIEVFFTKEALEFEGMYYEKANPLIIEKLTNLGHMLHVSYFVPQLSHMTGVLENQLFLEQPHSGLHRLLNLKKHY